ncbi:MAG: Ig-like domain-containing protein [Bacteroidota bacterium]|nr:Ig-like domain-containing protein [Bacteroidota bacterium]
MKTLYFTFTLLLFASCANIGTPSGGQKDKTPPKQIKSIPENYSINFTGNIIKLRFDENILLIRGENNINIFPKQTNPPEYEAVGKVLNIKLKDSLKPNTTYHIQLKEAISDINEGNTNNLIDFYFSTGNIINKGNIKGNIIDAYTGHDGTGYTVILNKQNEDSSIFRTEPDYVTFSSSKGEFDFGGVKDENYRIYVFKDENNNNKPDKNEMFGFYGPMFYVDSNTNNITIRTSYDKSLETPELRKYFCKNYGVFEFVVAPKGAYKRLVENNLFTDEAYLLEFGGIDEDTLIWFSPSAEMQDGHFDVYVNDWWWRDVTMAHQMSNKIRRQCWLTNNIKENGKLDLFDTLNIRFHSPIWNYDDRNLELYEDSIKIKYVGNSFFRDNEKSQYVLPIDLKPDKNYLIKFKDGAFNDIFNQKIDSFSIKFKTEKSDLYGSLIITMNQTQAKPLLVELLDEKLNPIRSNIINGSNKLEYKYLLPGNYRIRIVDDINLNNKMDDGYINKGKNPEKTFLFDDIIPITQNIDLDNINIDLDKVKF